MSFWSSRIWEKQWCYRFGAEFRGEYVSYGCDEQHVELLAQAQEVAEGEDDHLFGMSV